MGLEEFTPGVFRPLVGDRFAVEQGDPLELQLVEVRELPPHAYRAEPFALLFRGPRQPRLAQGMHVLAHGRLGRLEIFLVPVQGGADGLAYEAIFN